MRDLAVPVTLDATVVSRAAPLPSAGGTPMTVHSIFRSALNVAGPRGLLTIAPSSVGGLPNGVLVAGLCDFRSLGLVAGMRVARRGDRIEVDRRLIVRLAGATPWCPARPAVPPDHAARRWRGRSVAVHRHAAAARSATGILAVPRIEHHLAELALGVAMADPATAGRAAARLVGLGPGLTPGGDDLLVGCEAALRAIDHQMAGALAGPLRDLEARTTAISAALLAHAARGEFSERLLDLLGALLGADDAAVPGAIRRTCAWGASSGSDAVVGVLLGLDAALLAPAGVVAA